VRVIHSIYDSNGNPQTSPIQIIRTFTVFLRRKYDTIKVDEECVQNMANAIDKTLTHAANAALSAPVTMDELYLAVKSGKPHKVPGCDGICQEFFKVTWEERELDMLDMLKQMHSNGTVLEQQKHGLLLCLAKTCGLPTPHPAKCRP
jgi:hypothetical protein